MGCVQCRESVECGSIGKLKKDNVECMSVCNDEAVQKVLAEEKAIKEKTLYSSKSQNRESKTEECRYHKEGRGDSEIKDKSTVQDQKIKEELKEEESKQRENEKYKDYENHPNNFDKTVNESEKYEKERIKNRLSKSEREPEKIRNKEKEEGEGEKEECDRERDKERKEYEGGREKDRLREKDKPRDRDKDYEKVRDRGKEKDKRRERGKDIETTREERKDKPDKKPTGSEENVAKKLAEKSIKDQAEFDKENENSARLSKQQATKGPRQRNKTSSEGESFGDAEGDVLNTGTTEKISENNEFTNEIPSQITQRKPRPSSARPAPPRIKRQQSTEILIPERNGSAKIVSNVIIDKEEEEDDQFIVKAEQQLPEIAELKMETTVDLEEDEKHGSLVQRILETKKDYELSQLQKSAEKEKPHLSEAAKRKEKDLVTKEIEKFRGSIQALCRSALPLGKIMDYIQEDVDAMKNELQTWQNENKELEETLRKEQGITDGVVEPLKIDLTELDQLIKDEEDKIYTKRANVWVFAPKGARLSALGVFQGGLAVLLTGQCWKVDPCPAKGVYRAQRVLGWSPQLNQEETARKDLWVLLPPPSGEQWTPITPPPELSQKRGRERKETEKKRQREGEEREREGKRKKVGEREEREKREREKKEKERERERKEREKYEYMLSLLDI
ncbi:TRAF3-interacting protein 1 [Crotalus adamanteus]|uniref:TRAF3-interacting protein 1 n=1 Tax=Crotalus adamanteus TaxID=8729 RepID=A0AAW1C9W0_CROAD